MAERHVTPVIHPTQLKEIHPCRRMDRAYHARRVADLAGSVPGIAVKTVDEAAVGACHSGNMIKKLTDWPEGRKPSIFPMIANSVKTKCYILRLVDNLLALDLLHQDKGAHGEDVLLEMAVL